MKPIVNLTQHQATPEQVEAGVIDFDVHTRKWLGELLTFDEIPSHQDMVSRAREIVRTFVNPEWHDKAMIGGAPYFMPFLEKELRTAGVKPVYAFTKRESVEHVVDDGSVRKTNTFRHIGFVEA